MFGLEAFSMFYSLVDFSRQLAQQRGERKKDREKKRNKYIKTCHT
jgi:hypothetical protein